MDVDALCIRQARLIVQPYMRHNQLSYWFDLIVSASIGYACGAIYLASPAFSVRQIVALLIAGFAFFRVGSFIHEIVHMRSGQLLAFRTAWNFFCGIPMLMPSYFYENHIDHHKSAHYGTQRDGEYLPLGTSPLSYLLLFLAQVPVLPLYIMARFLISPLTFIHPKVRQWTLEHASSFVINFRHRLTIPTNAPRRVWALVELACFFRAAAMIAVVFVGVYDWTRIVQIYALAVLVLGLNYNRNLVAHHYRNRGTPMTHQQQLEDSVNIKGGWLTELFFPLNLRYHALHHLFPALPYHNLGKAHRRLMAELPADSVYHQTVSRTYWSALYELLADAHRAGRALRAARRTTGRFSVAQPHS
jgi:fatty acid desaturase